LLTPQKPRQFAKKSRGSRPVFLLSHPSSKSAKQELSSMSPNRAIAPEKTIRLSSLAAAQPWIILSRPEALNASGSRPACRMAISRNADSLIAPSDFPEFAPAVGHGVHGTLYHLQGTV